MAEHEREVIVTNGGGGGYGFLIGVILLIAVLVAGYFLFGRQLLNGDAQDINVNVNLPAVSR